MRRFKGKTAVVTGAASGIGQALAVELARRGANLVLWDINAVGLQATAEQARQRGVRVSTAEVDVANREAVHLAADAAVAEHGQVHLVINNAGVALGALVRHMRYEDLEWLMGINFWGVIHGTFAFMPHLEAAGEGHIVNISSVFGIIGVPTQAAYNAAKFAVRGFTESLRQELKLAGSPVSASCVHPGGVRTNIAAASRVGELGEFHRDPQAIADDFAKLARTTPAAAAKIILRGVERDQARILVGGDAKAIDRMQRLLPAGYQRVVMAMAGRQRRS